MIPLQVATIREYVQNTIVPNVVEFATNAATFLLTVAVVYYVGKAILLPLAERTLRARGAGETLVKPARKLTLVGVGFLAVTVGFAVAGFGNLLSSLATIVAALTLAIGFASQDLIGNLVAGAFLIGDPKVKIGDWIEWNDKEGIIEDISFRVSRVRTFDNGLITVPNSELANTALENPVAKDKRRIQFLFGVGYEEDLDHARDVIIEEANAHTEILSDPGVSVRLTELADSYVGLNARFWIADPSRADVSRIRSEYVQAVKERCDAESIEMPYPYQQLTGEISVENVGDADDPESAA